MYLVILFGAVFTFGAFIYLGQGYRHHAFDVPLSLFAGITGALVGLLIALMLGHTYTSPDDMKKIRTEQKIISLSNTSEVSGDFFLGTGSVGGHKIYYYYIDTPKGAINKRVKATEAFVEEQEGVEPKVVKVRFKDVSSGWYIVPPKKMEGKSYTRIFIPKGSIKRQYKPN